MSSILSISDRSFIEFTRCLYGAKTIVKELQVFGDTVSSTLYLPAYSHHQRYDLHISVDEFIDHVNQYLNESIHKFSGMCKIMLVLLAKLEKTRPIKRECIDSFRDELVLEWKKAELIKEDLVGLIHHKCNHPDYIKKRKSVGISAKVPLTSDSEEYLFTNSSESTPEPTSSESP